NSCLEELNIRGFGGVFKAFRFCPKLKKLNFDVKGIDFDSLFKNCSHLTSLRGHGKASTILIPKKLKLTELPPIPNVKRLETISKKYPNLERLTLKLKDFQKNSGQIGEILPKLPRLRCLTIISERKFN